MKFTRDIGTDAEIVTVVLSKGEAMRAICQMVCNNEDFDGRAWSVEDAKTLEAAARLIREAAKAAEEK